MLRRLELNNVGPAPSMSLDFGKRLNILTGDNGLGKSFLLDIAWWALTRKWPAEVNPGITSGKIARPANGGKASIQFSFRAKSKMVEYSYDFDKREEAWLGKPGRPPNPGLVLYAMVDGSFAVWDTARNYWKNKGDVDIQDRLPAYVFSATEVWNGLEAKDGTSICEGLIRDWASWQKEKGRSFELLKEVLRSLSPSGNEVLAPGDLTRISISDARDMPTIRMAYGQDIPVAHASAGIRRIIALAYLLVWTWEEHCKASKLLDENPTGQIIFLVDEIESHLHPRWQFQIVPALLNVMKSLTQPSMKQFLVDSMLPPSVQLITASHSPMVLASLEPVFDSKKDAWFDLDYEGQNRQGVVLTKREFERRGDVTNWLTSEAFDLASGRNPQYADLIQNASLLLEQQPINPAAIRAQYQRLNESLPLTDPFLFRWRAICAKKGVEL